MYPLEVKKTSAHAGHRSGLADLPWLQEGYSNPTAGAPSGATFFLWTIETL